jgi:hypothetical protein
MHMTTKDIVREVLEKDPKERTDEDLDILFEFMQSFPVKLFVSKTKFNIKIFQNLLFQKKNNYHKIF